jgi:hypothetical protein
MASDNSDQSDDGLQRVLDILQESSEEEFSGFESDDSSDSDNDALGSSDESDGSSSDDQNERDEAPTCQLQSGPKLPRNFNTDNATPLDYFKLMLPDNFYSHISAETIAYARRCQDEKGEDDDLWDPPTGEEIRAYFGLNILMGISPRHSYCDYWKDDDFLGIPGFRNAMTLNRYEKITQYLHINNAAARTPRNDPDYHPVNKVKPIYDLAKSKFKQFYQHGTEISIDEAMKGFKGRCEIRQYMPAKPEKFGIKFWARCDGNSSYLSEFQLYTGKRDRNQIQQNHGLGYRVVHDLTRDLVGLNHHIYHDRFFTSAPLAAHLYEEDIYTCGTVNPNRKDLPKPLRQKKRVIKKTLVPNRGDSVSYERRKLTVTAWNDNNIVIVLYNNCNDDSVGCYRQVDRNRVFLTQPKALANYNKYMNGVDLHDQMRKKYAAGRPSKKYWKYIMWFVIDCIRVNAYLLYKEASTRVTRKKRYTHFDFILELGKALVGNYSSRKRVCLREVYNTDVENQQVPHVHIRMEGNRRRCKPCYMKGVRKEVVKGCPTCNVHLCAECFRATHS